MENKTANILSIDAWRDGNNWTWNQWFKVGTIMASELEGLKNNRAIIRYMRDNGFLSDASKGRVTVEDDQYNLVIIDRKTYEPLFAIEYGQLY